MPTVEANGQTLYYEEHGEGEPLVCLMGLSADVLAWTLQVPAFSARYRTILIDNRDVGRSSRADGPYEIADMARDTLALAQDQPRGAHRRAASAQPLGGVLRERGRRGLHARPDARDPAPAGARSLRAPARGIEPARHA